MVTAIPFMLTESTLGQVGREGHALQMATELYNRMHRAAERSHTLLAIRLSSAGPIPE